MVRKKNSAIPTDSDNLIHARVRLAPDERAAFDEILASYNGSSQNWLVNYLVSLYLQDHSPEEPLPQLRAKPQLGLFARR